MNPIIIELDQFSDDPGNNYLQLLLSFAVNDGTTDIYFYKAKKNTRIFRNAQTSAKSSFSELEAVLDNQQTFVLEKAGLLYSIPQE